MAQYAIHLRNGSVNGGAQPVVQRRKGGVRLIDAQEGLAFPACDLAVAEAVAVARTQGVAVAGVVNSHHCGVVVDHLRAAAAAGMMGLGFSNSLAGGRHPVSAPTPWRRYSRAASCPRHQARP